MRMMKQNKRKQQLLMAVAALGAAGNLITTVSADAQSADTFDLTKQATNATFPVMFDRPSGINTAAIGGAVRSLGESSELYQSALKAVPEIGDANKIGSLLNNSLSEDKATATEARATILKLINWYNSLGGFQIKTQSGQAYTADNLDEPINTIAVGFANKEANQKVSDKIQGEFGTVKTTGDVMKALDKYKSDASAGFTKTFKDYSAKVTAPGADINALSDISAVQPLLSAYEKMYSDGAAAMRAELLKTDGANEAAVAFFESAVITGHIDNYSSDSKVVEQPKPENRTTRWVDQAGKELSPNETGSDYKSEKEFPGYRLRESRVDNGVKTYVYDKTSSKTSWVDQSGARLKEDVTGTFPDKEGDDIKGYHLIKSETKTTNGNTTTINVYEKDTKVEEKPVQKHDTYWFDGDGNELKPVAKGQSLPDNDGVSDIPGYTLLKAYIVTQDSLNGDLKGSKFQIGDVINIYDKAKETPKEEPKVEKPTTKWVDEAGKELKPSTEGSHPDEDGNDIPGHKLIRINKDDKGNVVNVYEKIKEEPKVDKPTTKWVDEAGKELKPSTEGSHPDEEGDDVPGYKLLRTNKDEKGNVVNVYEKVKEEPKADKPMTKWVDEVGKELKPSTEGSHPDEEGDDVPGYKLLRTNKDEKGNVVNVYEKVKEEPKQPVEEHKVRTTWVDENGQTLKEAVDGSFPDAEGDDIPGYELVHTNTAKNGDIENVYRKVTKEVVTHFVTKDGTRLAADEKGEDFSKEKDIDGYQLVDVRTSKDGTQKYYIYDKVEDEKASPKVLPKSLPKTGDVSGILGVVGTMMTALGGLTLRKKKNEE